MKETANSTIIVGDFSYSTFNKEQQKINKKIDDMNNIIGQPDLTDFYRTFHPTTEYTFSTPYGTFSRTEQTLGHKTISKNLNAQYVL